MKVIMTTSNAYHHLLPISLYLFKKYWDVPLELVGYDHPPNLPPWVTFVSLGKQGSKTDFSNELRPYFEKQPQYFVWICEDTFIKKVDLPAIEIMEITLNQQSYIGAGGLVQMATAIGKFCLTNESMRRYHSVLFGSELFSVSQNADYRLSTQPAIWNRDFLLQYLTPNLSIWDFETQHPKNDDWKISGFRISAIESNEGVRKQNIYDLDLNGICDEDLIVINKIKETW